VTTTAPETSWTYGWEDEPRLEVTVYGLAGPQGSKTPVGWGRSRKTGKAIPLMRESSKKVKPWREKVAEATAQAWEDDGRVIESHSRKVYPGEHPDALPEPGAIIRLYTLPGDPR
jgi:hypothetical protein